MEKIIYYFNKIKNKYQNGPLGSRNRKQRHHSLLPALGRHLQHPALAAARPVKPRSNCSRKDACAAGADLVRLVVQLQRR